MHNLYNFELFDALKETDGEVLIASNEEARIAADIFEETDLTIQLELIKDFKLRTASQILEEMEPDEVADIIGELSEENEEKAQELLDSLPKEDSDEVSELLTYPEDSAGGLMSTDYI